MLPGRKSDFWTGFGLTATRPGTTIWVPEGSLAGIFWVGFWGLGGPPHFWMILKPPGAAGQTAFRYLDSGSGPARPLKTDPTNPARLPSGTQYCVTKGARCKGAEPQKQRIPDPQSTWGKRHNLVVGYPYSMWLHFG